MSESSIPSAEALRGVEPIPQADHPPLLRAPEKIRTIFIATTLAACLPLAAGVLFFGWRAAWVAILSVVFCASLEWLYFRVTHTPAMLGRSHAYLTGVLLALTLPPVTPWWIVLLAAMFAILVGKAIFGGVGHFLWQPALVGRFAVAVIVPALAAVPPLGITAADWPDLDPDYPRGVLSQDHLLLGDIQNTRRVHRYLGWRDRPAPSGADGFALRHPSSMLDDLTRVPRNTTPAYSAMAEIRSDIHNRKPVALTQLPPMADMLLGARPGGIGETSAVVILVAGLYLVYRNYVKWQLPMMFLLGAGLVAAIAPIHLAGHNNVLETVWFPLVSEGLDVGFTYVCYQMLSGAMLLVAFFLATEMTSSPVTPGGQAIFGFGCGVTAMVLNMQYHSAIPAYLAVLAWNTFVPTIDAIWRPRVFGQRRFAWLPWQRKA